MTSWTKTGYAGISISPIVSFSAKFHLDHQGKTRNAMNPDRDTREASQGNNDVKETLPPAFRRWSCSASV